MSAARLSPEPSSSRAHLHAPDSTTVMTLAELITDVGKFHDIVNLVYMNLNAHLSIVRFVGADSSTLRS